MNFYAYVGNNPVNWVDPWGLYIGQLPAPPPGYNSAWTSGIYPNGRYWVQDPEGNRWVAHPEDKFHWRHWDGPDNDRWPYNSKKRRPNQKKSCKDDQSDTDPNGNVPSWSPNEVTDTDPLSPTNIFIYPVIPTPRFPAIVPIPTPSPAPVPVLVY